MIKQTVAHSCLMSTNLSTFISVAQFSTVARWRVCTKTSPTWVSYSARDYSWNPRLPGRPVAISWTLKHRIHNRVPNVLFFLHNWYFHTFRSLQPTSSCEFPVQIGGSPLELLEFKQFRVLSRVPFPHETLHAYDAVHRDHTPTFGQGTLGHDRTSTFSNKSTLYLETLIWYKKSI